MKASRSEGMAEGLEYRAEVRSMQDTALVA